MANRFFVWQDPSQQPENITWIELNGLEFYKLVSSKEANGRYFITLDNDISPEDDVIYIEATKEQYQDWEKTLSHHRYLAKFYGKYEITMKIWSSITITPNTLNNAWLRNMALSATTAILRTRASSAWRNSWPGTRVNESTFKWEESHDQPASDPRR